MTEPDQAARLTAYGKDAARIYQSARDQHLHFHDGVTETRHATPGAVDVCPYPGLAAFTSEQADWFFGRERLTADVTGRAAALLNEGSGLLVLVGPSGAGKSSLLRAGFLNAVARGALPVTGSAQWPRLVMTPTAQPVAELDQQLAGYPDGRLVLVIDQLEELFTLCDDDALRRRFVDRLTELAGRALIVLGLRADFYAPCADHAALREALQRNQVFVGPMSREQLRHAIMFPARAAGLDLEPALVDVLLRDLGDEAAGRLPFLAHALQSTWQARHGDTLTVAGYNETGGISHAIATTADRVYDTLGDDGQLLARTLLLRLVKVGDGTEDTRRRLSRTEIAAEPRAATVLEAFTDARLLAADTGTVEITHEALLRGWPRLRQWIEADRAGHVLHQELEDAAAEWRRPERRDASLLYRGARLDAARAWAATARPGETSPAAAEFLAASRRYRSRTRVLVRGAIVALSALTVATSITAVVAVQRGHQATVARDKVIFNQVVAEAGQYRTSDSTLAVKLDLAAYRMRPTADVRDRLLSDQRVPLSQVLMGHRATVNAVAFRPDGKVLASGSDDKDIRLWDTSAPDRPRALGAPLTGHLTGVLAVTFSPDGHTLASAGADGAIRLWDVSNPGHPAQLGRPLQIHNSVNALRFSPDGRVLASASHDGSVRLWDVRDLALPSEIGQPMTGAAVLMSVAFSHDGQMLATAATDGRVQLWNVADPLHPVAYGQAFVAHAGAVGDAEFGRDDKLLFTCGEYGDIAAWNIGRPAAPLRITGWYSHPDTVTALSLDPSGTTLASASQDGSVRLWDVANPANPVAEGDPLTGHSDSVEAVAFGSDDHTLASGSSDHTVRLWRLPGSVVTGFSSQVWSTSYSPLGHLLAAATGGGLLRLFDVSDPDSLRPVGSSLPGVRARFSPSGRLVAAIEGNGSVRVYDISDPAHPHALGAALPGWAAWVEFRPDSRLLAIGDRYGSVRLIDLTAHGGPRLVGTAYGSTETVYVAAFTPDGRTLITGGVDGVIRLFDVAEPTIPFLLGRASATRGNFNVTALALGPDGHTLAVGSNNRVVYLYDIGDLMHPRELGQPLIDHTNVVTSVAFLPGGRVLASASGDGTIRLWDTSDPARARSAGELIGPDGFRFWQVDADPRGGHLVTAGSDGAVRLWNLDVNAVIKDICVAAGGGLSAAEWKRYVSDEVPRSDSCHS